MQTILANDTHRIFADWGITAQLEEVSHYYDPETGQVEESVSSSEIIILIGSQYTANMKSTEANAHHQTTTILVQKESLPEDFNPGNAQIRLPQLTYQIVSVDTASLPNLLALTCLSEAAD